MLMTYSLLRILRNLLYADDTALVVTSETCEDVLYNASIFFTALSIWFADNPLTLNSSKTNSVLFGTANTVNTFPQTLEFNNHKVARVNVVKYLGIYIDCCLS